MIDFEEDAPDSDVQRLQQGVREVGEGVKRALATASKGRLLTAGLQVTPHTSFPCWFLSLSQIRMHSHLVRNVLAAWEGIQSFRVLVCCVLITALIYSVTHQ